MEKEIENVYDDTESIDHVRENFFKEFELYVLPDKTESEEIEQDTEVIQTVSYDTEIVNNQLNDITLCLVVIICLIGVTSGVLIGSILWGRVRK